jgi:hypothetical protein
MRCFIAQKYSVCVLGEIAIAASPQRPAGSQYQTEKVVSHGLAFLSECRPNAASQAVFPSFDWT